MNCGNCAREIDGEPVWAVYGDPSLEGRRQEPIPLHPECFAENETVTVSEWRPIDGDPVERKDAQGRTVRDGYGAPVMDTDELVHFEITRYRKVAAPGG